MRELGVLGRGMCFGFFAKFVADLLMQSTIALGYAEASTVIGSAMAVAGLTLIAIAFPTSNWFYRMGVGSATYLFSSIVLAMAATQLFTIGWGYSVELWNVIEADSWEHASSITTLKLTATILICAGVLGFAYRVLLFSEVLLWSTNILRTVEVPSLFNEMSEIERRARLRCDWAGFWGGGFALLVDAMGGSSHASDRGSRGGLTKYDWIDTADGDGSIDLQFNPANGLPMIGDSGIDVAGNVFGFDDHHDSTDSEMLGFSHSFDSADPFDSMDSFGLNDNFGHDDSFGSF